MNNFARNLVFYFGLIVLSASSGLYGQAADLFFSEYVEGSGSNQALEIYNGTGAPVNLAPYEVVLFSSGGSEIATFALDNTGTSLGDGETLVIANANADVSLRLLSDATSNVAFFNGNDSVGLKKDNDLIDLIGIIGAEPGPWGSGELTTIDHTLRRLESVTSGDPDGFDDPLDLSAQWAGFEQDNFDGVGAHPGLNAGGGGGGGEDLMAEIFEIQGSGTSSVFDDLIVTTENNVVTGVISNGFFMQTPTERDDGNPATSNGIFLFTGGAPSVAVGELVNVTGIVQEFFDMTEFTTGPVDGMDGPIVTVLSSGNPLPEPVQLDESNPSPDPESPVNFERYEGMRVAVASGIVTGPTDFFGNLQVAAKSTRTFREPGIIFPGETGRPVWDGNPEVFELDPDGFDLEDVELPAGTTFDASGVLFFSFGMYQILPDVFNFTASTLPRAVRDRNSGEFTVATQNFRQFSDADADFSVRREKFSRQIREVLQAPDILGVQEVQTLSTLESLAARIQQDDAGITYTAYMISTGGAINNGFLVRGTITVDAVTEMGRDEEMSIGGTLHDRPPVLLSGTYTGTGMRDPFPIKVLVVHNRSLIDSNFTFTQTKRLEQAQSIAQMAQDIQTADPNAHLVVCGDFNAFEFTDGYVDMMGQIMGDITPADNSRSGPDLVDPNLINLIFRLPPGERYSFNLDGNSEALDHILTSITLDPFVTEIAYGRSNSDAPADFDEEAGNALRSSDHDGLVAYIDTGLEPDVFGGVDIDGFAGWKASAWYLNYNVDHWPWIYHDEHGWQFVFDGSAPDTIFLFDLGLQNWIFLNRFTYRWEYLFGENKGWIFTFENNTPNLRFFQRLDDASLFSIPPDA